MQEEEEENTGKKTKAASFVYHGPSSFSPPPEAPLASTTPLRSHCRGRNTVDRRGKKQSKQTA
jgi:hypothetical protein